MVARGRTSAESEMELCVTQIGFNWFYHISDHIIVIIS